MGGTVSASTASKGTKLEALKRIQERVLADFFQINELGARASVASVVLLPENWGFDVKGVELANPFLSEWTAPALMKIKRVLIKFNGAQLLQTEGRECGVELVGVENAEVNFEQRRGGGFASNVAEQLEWLRSNHSVTDRLEADAAWPAEGQQIAPPHHGKRLNIAVKQLSASHITWKRWSRGVPRPATSLPDISFDSFSLETRCGGGFAHIVRRLLVLLLKMVEEDASRSAIAIASMCSPDNAFICCEPRRPERVATVNKHGELLI